jgi:hypothetical protein
MDLCFSLNPYEELNGGLCFCGWFASRRNSMRRSKIDSKQRWQAVHRARRRRNGADNAVQRILRSVTTNTFVYVGVMAKDASCEFICTGMGWTKARARML